ncbi:hypothetical protein GF356_05205 [candidate division GN15 bacterium]|nr:hypothetical protein [candidate division GN15 bacterium]
MVTAVGAYKTMTDHSTAEQPTGSRAYWLSQNYPNPFNPSTSFTFSLAERGQATLEVFNVRGQKVATILLGREVVRYNATVCKDRTRHQLLTVESPGAQAYRLSA